MENLTKELPFELSHFQVEELEERLENKWGSSDTCVCDRTNANGETVQYISSCPCSGDPGPTIPEIVEAQQ